MRIPSGVTDQYIYFVAVDSTDYATRETGLSSFTVYRSRNGAAAAAMTTPTINETDSTNMPGVYELLLDEDMTIGSGNDSEEMCFHITATGMAPVTRTIELYRSKITAGETLTVSSGVGSANAVQVSGDSTAADNLEADYDGTGYNKSNSTIGTCTTNTDMITTAQVNAEVDTALADIQLDHLMSTSATGINVADNSVIAKMCSSGATADFSTFDNTTDSLEALQADTTAIEADTQDIQSRLPAALVGGKMDSDMTAVSGDTVAADNIEADYDGTGYNKSASTIGTCTTNTDMITTAEVNTEVDTALADFFTSSAQLVDDIWDEVLTAGTHNVNSSSGKRLRELQESGAVYGGYIWIDTNVVNTNTDSYIDGTSDNPVSTIAAANTLASALNISRFKVAPGSSITLAQTQANQLFDGHTWTLALGGQNIAGSVFIGATVSGTATGSALEFKDCDVGTVTLADCTIKDSALTGTITASAAGDYYFSGCHSGVAGSGTPVFDFGAAVANTNLNMRHYSGGIQIDNKNSSGTDLMSLEGNGQLIVSASSGGAISLRGNFNVTNTGGATITYDDNSQGIQDIETDTAEIGTAGAGLTDLGGMSTSMKAEVNTEVSDVLKTDTISEMSQQAPPATPTFEEAVMYLYMALRNKLDVTATLKEFHNDAGTVIWKKTLSDDGTTYSEAEGVTGP